MAKKQNIWERLEQKQRREAKLAKKLFTLLELLGDGVYEDMHIIDTSDGRGLRDDKKQFRVYHAKGYCFDVSKEPVDTDKSSINYCEISGHEYQFMEGIYDGFKYITIEKAIILTKELTHG